MAAWVFLLFLLPFLLIFRLRKTHKFGKINPPPGPRGLPWIGNMHQFESEKPHEYLRDLSNKYGPLFSLKLGKVPLVVISSSKVAKEALKTHDIVFSGRPQRTAAKRYSYDGYDLVFAPYGEYWREMKKVSVLQLFTLKQVRSFRPILEEEISLMMKDISESSSSGQVVNLSSTVMNLTSTLICRIAFGKKYDKEDHGKKRFENVLHETEAISGGFFVSDYLPLLGWIDNLTGMTRRMEKNFQDLDLLCQELIEEHLNPNRPDTMKNDLLDLLIQIKNEQSFLNLTYDHIKAILMSIFIAGTDTSASLITWAMMALMQTPSAMKKVQAEIRDVVGENGTIDEETLQKLPYLDAVVKETFRLYPPTPLLVPRETIGSCNIEGYDIQPKTMVFINAWAIARDPKVWENPDDFIPDRFLNSNIDVKGNNFELIPFGAGRRSCPGMSLGLSTSKTSLANLLYSFNWELPTGMKIEDIDTDALPGITLHKKVPLCLVAKKYTK